MVKRVVLTAERNPAREVEFWKWLLQLVEAEKRQKAETRKAA